MATTSRRSCSRRADGQRLRLAAQGLVVKIARVPRTAALPRPARARPRRRDRRRRRAADVARRRVRRRRRRGRCLRTGRGGARPRQSSPPGRCCATSRDGRDRPPAEDVPSAGDVVAHFQRALDGGTPTPSGDVLGLLLELHRNNLDQWQREDATRAPGRRRRHGRGGEARHRRAQHHPPRPGRGHRRGTGGRSSSRRRRRRRPRRARRWCSTGCRCSPSASTSPRAPPVGPAPDGDRLPRPVAAPAASSSTIVVQALEGLFDDVRAGRKRFVPYQSLKLYGSPRGPVTVTARRRTAPRARSTAGSRRD